MCFRDGVWNEETDYSNCAIAEVYRRRFFFRNRILYVSIAVCLPAIIILFCSEKLKNSTRMVIHRNLLVVIVLRYSLTILSQELVLIPSVDDSGDDVSLSKNGIGCRVLSFVESCTLNIMYACMLADGFYLHKKIVRNYGEAMDIRTLQIIVAGIIFIIFDNLIKSSLISLPDRRNFIYSLKANIQSRKELNLELHM